MQNYILWFGLYTFVLAIFMIMGGMADAWMWRKKQDTDGKGHDFPNWLRNLMHVFWLGGFSVKFIFLPLFGYYSPVGIWTLLILTTLLAGGLSFLWDMTYSKLKHGIWTASLEYWWYTKKTVLFGITIPEIKIGWKSKKAVIFSYILRAGFAVTAFWYGYKEYNNDVEDVGKIIEVGVVMVSQSQKMLLEQGTSTYGEYGIVGALIFIILALIWLMYEIIKIKKKENVAQSSGALDLGQKIVEGMMVANRNIEENTRKTLVEVGGMKTTLGELAKVHEKTDENGVPMFQNTADMKNVPKQNTKNTKKIMDNSEKLADEAVKEVKEFIKDQTKDIKLHIDNKKG